MHPGIDAPVGRRLRSGRFGASTPALRKIIRGIVGAISIAGLVAVGGQGGAGHSVGHFPSYYPEEIRIEAMDPAAAARGLSDETLHAYVGSAPTFAKMAPKHVESVRSLGSIFVVSFKKASARFASAEARCTAAQGFIAALRDEKTDGFIFHPYPVTPYHADYLHHVDRVEAGLAAANRGSAPTASEKVGAKGRLAATIVRSRWQLATGDADVMLEEVPIAELFAGTSVAFDGWSGPPWAKEGWFEAHRLLAPALDPAEQEGVNENYARLIRGETIRLAERADLERGLVAALTRGCARIVVGYTAREEFVDAAYPAGIENVAYDSLSGLSSAVFFRTAKLKEYPWNGKLHIGVAERSVGGWNPVAGFADPMGRLIWSAIGDPAMIQFPFNASWMPNRVQPTVTRSKGQSGGIRVPSDTFRPQPGTGTLEAVGDRTFASAKVVYEVLASPFEDGTEMSAADAIYPFVFAYRWGAKAGDDTREPRLASTFATMQEHLVGLRLLRVERTKHVIAENWEIAQKIPVIEAYLRNVPHDEQQIAAIAPPWSTIPWHLLALMEEAVTRGYAAFSESESNRRRIPWMDLVRDRDLRTRLQQLIAQFERDSYRPEALKEFVTDEEAQERWRALAAFAEKNGHFLVTNGPYRLAEWGPDSIVLKAVRDVTYPLGFGTFDRFVNPPRAVIKSAARDGDKITVRANAEMVLKMGRDYKLTSEPLTRATMRGTFGLLVVSRYVLIGPDGTVRGLDKMHWEEDGRFTVDLPERLPPGDYTINLGIFLDGNSMVPSARSMTFRVVAGPPG